MEAIFHIVCWGFPLIPALYALANGRLGYYTNILWCSYTEPHSLELIVGLGAFLIPTTIIIMYCYYSIIIHVKQVTKESPQECYQRRVDTRATYRMTAYIANYFVGWFPYFISNVYLYANPTDKFFVLQLLISGVAHCQGITNFFLYCLNKKFIAMVKRRLFEPNLPNINISNHRFAVSDSYYQPSPSPSPEPLHEEFDEEV
eukprot:Phypoly_transcript_08146.p1 GENE.Phypoly_transcript_08146~~Phypoly_transcript_08146.p1  ORF type:complete len:202 (+),score=7.55 Phypoly_transcript_08146:565-1170(+)